MARLGVNKEYLKKRNRGLVLQLIATGKCSSRIELAKELHLTKTAISAIVNELIDQQYLKETAVTTKAKLGRTPIKLGGEPEGTQISGNFVWTWLSGSSYLQSGFKNRCL